MARRRIVHVRSRMDGVNLRNHSSGVRRGIRMIVVIMEINISDGGMRRNKRRRKERRIGIVMNGRGSHIHPQHFAFLQRRMGVMHMGHVIVPSRHNGRRVGIGFLKGDRMTVLGIMGGI